MIVFAAWRSCQHCVGYISDGILQSIGVQVLALRKKTNKRACHSLSIEIVFSAWRSCEHCVGYISDRDTSVHWSASAGTQKKNNVPAILCQSWLFKIIFGLTYLSTLCRLYKRRGYFSPLECKCWHAEKNAKKKTCCHSLSIVTFFSIIFGLT